MDGSCQEECTPNIRFSSEKVKHLITLVLHEELQSKNYDVKEAPNWCKSLADSIKNKLKESEYKHYKFVIQVIIGEQKGGGVNACCRCLWDENTDEVAYDTYLNETLFCVASAFGVYYY